jgi:hypothetical protein
MLEALSGLERNEVSGTRAAGGMLRELTLHDDDDFEFELQAAQRSKRRSGAVVLTFVGLLLVGATGWFYAEYKHNTARPGARVQPVLAEPVANEPTLAPSAVTPSAPPTQPELAAPVPTLAPALQELEIEPQQIVPTPELEPRPATRGQQREARREDRRRRSSRQAREEEPSTPSPREPEIVTPAVPDYAKLLPSNPY